jgi:hypothetical protein
VLEKQLVLQVLTSSTVYSSSYGTLGCGVGGLVECKAMLYVWLSRSKSMRLRAVEVVLRIGGGLVCMWVWCFERVLQLLGAYPRG